MFFGDVTDSAFAIKDNVSGVTLDWWNDLSHFPYLFTQLWLIEAGKSVEPAAGGGWIGKPFDVEINLNVLCINLFLCSPTASVAQKCSVFLTLGLCRRQFVDWFFLCFPCKDKLPAVWFHSAAAFLAFDFYFSHENDKFSLRMSTTVDSLSSAGRDKLHFNGPFEALNKLRRGPPFNLSKLTTTRGKAKPARFFLFAFSVNSC